MSALILFEDDHAALFEPVALTRSVARLRLGAWTHDERWARLFPERERAWIVRGPLEAVEAQEGASIATEGSGDTLFVAAALGSPDAATLDAIRALEPGEALLAEGRLVAARAGGQSAGMLAGALRGIAGDALLPAAEVGSGERAVAEAGLSPREVAVDWPVTLADLVSGTAGVIERDFATYASLLPPPDPVGLPAVHLLEPGRIRCADGVQLDPGVVLDARGGPILLGTGVRIGAHSVITGPAVLAHDCLVKPLSRVGSGVSLGPVSRVGGEMHSTIFQGFSNKQHDGFLGDSYLGSWVNLGAATDTSNLRNDYGHVKLELAGRTVDTGRRGVGSLIGDHSKTAIHTRLNTGTVIGVSCNVFGAGIPPRAVPSFSWGGAGAWQPYRLDKALAVAAIVTSRRGIELTEADRALLARVHQETEDSRRTAY